MRSTLVVVRAPKCASVMSWIFELVDVGVVDLAISTYKDADVGDNLAQHIRFSHHFVGGKWIALFDFFTQHPELLDRYEYFWFPDDDIEATPQVAREFLSISQEERFALSQPALSADSYYAHRLTLANPRFKFRRTNFVELMLPLMRSVFLKRVLPLFAGRHAALGLDFFWHQLTDDPLNDVAIVDATPMGHYRPRQTHLKNVMTTQQVDIMKEKARTFAEFNISWGGATIFSAVTKGGNEVSRGLYLWWTYFLGISDIRRSISRPQWSNVATLRMFRELMSAKPSGPNFDRAAYEQLLRKTSF